MHSDRRGVRSRSNVAREPTPEVTLAVTQDQWPGDLPEPRKQHRMIAAQMRARARRGWYIGDMETLQRYGAFRDTQGVTEPDLTIRLLLTRDKMHHSVGWWRNADYEYCWHLSMSAKSFTMLQGGADWQELPYEEIPRNEVRFWSRLVFGDYVNMLWNEPGGTDPRLSREEKQRNALIWHLRLFLDPRQGGRPFIPEGEVYTLTRWVDGLTPPKVDR